MSAAPHSGKIQPSRVVTMRDVAQAAGVSTATVSRALAGHSVVRQAVRDHVLATIQKLNYHPNRIARDLRSGLRKVIGVIIPDLQNPYLTEVVQGVESVICEAGYSLTLGNSDGLADRERTHLAVVRGEGAAGLIIVPSNDPRADYRPLLSWDIPVVAVDRMPRGLQIDLISTTNYQGAREATEHLLSHGYREIAFINGPREVSVAQDRLAGYGDALRAAGAPLRDPLIVHADFRQPGGKSAMRQLLKLAKPPRAVLVGNNLMTLGAVQAIHECGKKIPDEIALFGFDDMPWAMSLRPPLSAVAQPALEAGRAAAHMLLERLSDPHRLVRQLVLPTRLVVRSSCGEHAGDPAKKGHRHE
ncbi:MAG TPA: LacI family DNA-binding transcriptional regulator [Verrucomicrobiae bacterium]|jgi:DNA-binding LacI/PurR family transcriptional regulator|nr:LacI family DNA-binding transcriptional regulator [Verrucomicrobiae bacterium]